MKRLLLISITVAFIATGAMGLKCYQTDMTEMTCPDVMGLGGDPKCQKTFASKKHKVGIQTLFQCCGSCQSQTNGTSDNRRAMAI